MTRLINFFLFSAIFISIVAVAMTWHTMEMFHITTDFTLLKVIALCTLLSYNIHGYFTHPHTKPSIQVNWYQQHKRWMLYISCFAFLLLGYLLLKNPTYIIPLIPAGIASALYTIPKIPYTHFQPIKKWAIAKTLYLAIVWTYVTVVLPYIIHQPTLSNNSLWYILNQFCYIYVICILFDYKDIKADLAAGIPSIFHHWGVDNAFKILYAFIFLGMFSCIWMGEKNLVLIHFVPYIAMLYAIPFVKKGMNDYFYYGWLDGCMMAACCLSLLEKL